MEAKPLEVTAPRHPVCPRCKLRVRDSDERHYDRGKPIHWPRCPTHRSKKPKCPYCKGIRLKAGYRDGVGYVECKDCKATTYFPRLASNKIGDFVKLDEVLGVGWERRYVT